MKRARAVRAGRRWCCIVGGSSEDGGSPAGEGSRILIEQIMWK